MTKNYPNIGADRLVIAEITAETETAMPTYATPIAMSGMVEVQLNYDADVAPFYADDGVYVQTAQPGQITVPITVSGVKPETYAYIFGHTYDSDNGQIIAKQGDRPREFAVGYRSQVANGKYEYFWFYKGIFTKASKTLATKAAGISYATTPSQFNAQPVKVFDGTLDGYLLYQSFSTDDENAPVGLTDAALDSITTGWFSTPNYTPVAPGTPIADFAVVTGVGDSGTIDATFSAATGADLVYIQCYDAISDSWLEADLSADLDATSTSAIIEGLTAGNTYNCRLIVVGGASNGISNEDSAAAKA